ncbi:MAG TPA: hypothetical protein VK151_02180 [Fluviicola sp.]|nr:hypothetical protein [Fluviicola sp.]
MKLLYLILIALFAANATFAQLSVRVLSLLDSSAVFGVVCSNETTYQLAFTDAMGTAKFASGGTVRFTHPSFYGSLIPIKTDTTIYLAPLIGDLEEVVISPTSNEAVFVAVISNYRKHLKTVNVSGELDYATTNWFKYRYKTDHSVDSAYCAIRDELLFGYNGSVKKSKPLFSAVSLNRYCSDFKLEKNSSIRTNEIPAFSKFDFSLFLEAVFTEGSFFDKIGFRHTQSTQRQDTINGTTELSFTTPECVKTIVFSTEDRSLISYTFRFFGKLGGYHYYYATFSDGVISTLFEEKGYLFDDETNSHELISVHYGTFETTEKMVLMNPLSFAEILKTQSGANNGTLEKIEVLRPLYAYLLW